MTLAHLSGEELLDGLQKVFFETKRLLVRLLLHLLEVEARRLDLRSACSSMFDFCVRRHGMSESEAFRRIDAARLVKRFPCLIDALERGDVNLTTMLLLRDHFTTDNVVELVAAARGKTKREVQELIAARAPKPDVFSAITELPLPPLLPPTPPRPAPKARIEPLSPSRHRMELTIGGDVRAKLERARDLLGHRIPDGNLEAVLDRALDALLASLEKERPGNGIPAKVRREVFARDEERCAYTNDKGHRCESRTRLEIDHIVPRARGGGNDAANLRVVCRGHNRLYAEQTFGPEHVAQQIHLRQRKCEDAPLDVARGAMVHLGFRERDARRTLEKLFPPASPLPPLPELLRQALAAMVT